MRYLNPDGSYTTFHCGVCRAELFFQDEREDDGTGYVFSWCPDCDEQRGFSFYGGEVDLDLLRTQVDERADDFKVFP